MAQLIFHRIKVSFISIVFFSFVTFLYILEYNHKNNESLIESELPFINKMFVHSRRQMLISTQMVTIDQNRCNSAKPLAIFIHTSAQSSGKYYKRREKLRSEWLSEAKKQNISVYFAIGLNENNKINKEIEREANQYRDIIQFGFKDDYYNLTIKSVAIFRWIRANCKVKYILKVDDDAQVNLTNLIDNLSHIRHGFYGELLKRTTPKRNYTSKWFLPYGYYQPKYYPDYIRGYAYVFSTSIVPIILNSIDNYLDYFIYVDDVFITGIIANQAGISRHNFTSFIIKNDNYDYYK